MQPHVSVLMPSYEQAPFLPRALASLQAQSLDGWEAVIVDASPTDATRAAAAPWLDDPRVRFLRIAEGGLGRALNVALDAARAPLVAYLPCDDLYHRDHLREVADVLQAAPRAVLAFSGVRHHYNREAPGGIEGEALQLVQCMHRRVDARWIERDELESDDLERLYWHRLRPLGAFAGTGRVSCEWVEHPAQRHKRMREPEGGISPFRLHYRVNAPLCFHSTAGNFIDEVAPYRHLRERPGTPPAADGLKILLVGELAYNADRVLALEERGHRLYGLWMPNPYWYNTVGPLPFGHVTDLPHDDWRAAVHRLQPDVIYALLNWQAVPFVHEVRLATPGVPFVWHFKEGPFICLEKGTWPLLIDLYRRASGHIYSSPELRDWFDAVMPGLSRDRPCHVLDGDLPRREWFERAPATRAIRVDDGEIHTVVPGRPIGLHPPDVAALAARGIHLHFHGDFTHGQWRRWIETTLALAPRHLHLHPHIDAPHWVEAFSRYDAGWLHAFESNNGGELRRANWDDLNYPARMSTLAAAGLPMIQRVNDSAIVATQTLTRELGVGLHYESYDDLAAQLRDQRAMQALRANVWRQRDRFAFDTHAPALVDFFRRVIGA